MFSAKSFLCGWRPFAKTLKLVVWAFSLNFLLDSTLFVIDIHQNMPISLILTPFDYFQIRPSFGVTPNLILEPCLKLLKQSKLCCMWQIYNVWQGSRMRLGVTAKVRRIWKWSNGVKISEMGIFWCISITNNVKSCRKFNEKAQTVNFSVFTMCGRELPAEKAYFW